MEPRPLRWEGRVLATGPAGKSQVYLFKITSLISGCVGLYCCVGFSLVMESEGYSPVVVPELLNAVAALTGGLVVSGALAQAPQLWHTDVAALW